MCVVFGRMVFDRRIELSTMCNKQVFGSTRSM